MFVHHCTACDRRQLIFPSQVKAIQAIAGGTRLHFTCWCGAERSHELVERMPVAA